MIPDIRHWRRWTWLLLAWSFGLLGLAFLLTAMIGGLCNGLDGLGLGICSTGTAAGTVILWTTLGAAWAVGFVILAIPWFARRPARRLCPPYGHPVDPGETRCRACGYDFIAGVVGGGEPTSTGPTAGVGSPGQPGA